MSGAETVASSFVVLGKVVDAHGLRGEIRVHPFADDPEVWSTLPRWWLGREGDAPETWQCLPLIHCREHAGLLVATLEGIADRDASESLRGKLVGAPREVLPVEENAYYWCDLVGLEVLNAHGQTLGHVAGLIETGANDVLRVVARENGEKGDRERLLPFVDAVVQQVDLPGRRILVDWELDW